jgi:hypothetical protein
VLTFKAPSSQLCTSDPRLGDNKSNAYWADGAKYGQLVMLVAIVLLSAYLEWMHFLKRHENSQRRWGEETFGEAARRWRRTWACYGLGHLGKVLQYTWPLSALIALVAFVWLLFDGRRKFSKSFGPDEDEWGVGQILALVLFINPFVDFFFSVWQVNSE